MTRPRRRPSASSHRYPRSARLNELLREVLAEDLERIDDDRLQLVTITRVDVDSEMNRGTVYFDSALDASGDATIIEAFSAYRIRLQGAIGRQVRAKKTPILDFRPDLIIRGAEHIDQILRDNPIPVRPEAPVDDDLDDPADADDDAD
jgi:ribosome-binding factor A